MTQKEKHLQALNRFAGRVKKDPNVIALLLYGSLAYGTVGEKSDIDVELVVRDGTVAPDDWYFIEEEGVEFEVTGFQEITKFKNSLQGLRNGFDHGMYGKGIIIFSKDEALTEMFEDTRRIGENDAPRAYATKISSLLNWMVKAEKWITILNDTLYAQRFLQMSASIVAEMELIRHRENPSREAILRAQQLNPDLMHAVYVIPSTTAMSVEDIRRTLKVLDDYLMRHMEWWSRHILRFLSDGEVKKFSHIWKQCGGGVPLEYLAEKGVIMRTTQPTRMFKKSKLTVEEIAYCYLKEDHHD
ncbi:MAG: nucleotidyltransferase domain-containing protein [Defluviitaleaceae bacterium]|nr:nucleotidyltransferase domain-containing protein [Defluviitaleaceae bacterium]